MELQERANIPTIIPIGKNFSPGKGIKVRCMVTPGASRFSIALFCGPDVTVQENAALHISFNLLANNASVSSKRGGVSDREVYVQGVPFDLGEGFEVYIHCEQEFYKIYVNGSQYSEYPQNISYDKITFLMVKGDVNVERIVFEPNAPCQFVFGNGTVPPVMVYKMQYPLVQQISYDPTTVPLNVTCIRETPRSLSWKVYALYGVILLLAVTVILCVIFIPNYGSKYEYDFD